MEIKCKLAKKTFTNDRGEERPYYVLQFTLIDGSTMELPVKGDKAKLLLLSYSISGK